MASNAENVSTWWRHHGEVIIPVVTDTPHDVIMGVARETALVSSTLFPFKVQNSNIQNEIKM